MKCPSLRTGNYIFAYRCKHCSTFWKSNDIEHYCYMCHSPDIVTETEVVQLCEDFASLNALNTEAVIDMICSIVTETEVPATFKRCPRCFESALDATWHYCPRCGEKLQ
jgi:hypothetical protein